MEVRCNCYGCPDRNTLEHPNPDCHTERCLSWKLYVAEKERNREERWQHVKSVGCLADGYRKRNADWIRRNKHK